jgi:hypothetical protein
MSTTNSAPNFASILDEAPGEVRRAPPAPAGTYHCKVGQWEPGQSSKKKTPFIKFALRPLMALEDVDAEQLEEAGGIEGRNLSVTFYITEDAVAMLDEFHQNCGLDLKTLEAQGVSRRARNDMVMNADVLAVVTHRVDEQDPSRVFAEVRRTARAD